MSLTLETVLKKLESDKELLNFVDSPSIECEPNLKHSIRVILLSLSKTPTLAPKIEAADSKEVLSKWINKYLGGYRNRISQRKSNLPGTIPDSVIDFIIKSRFGEISNNQLEQIKYAHRLSMSAENILGLLLEEYLAERLSKLGWHCCWGETVKSVDFCHEDGRLLQIKNRSNSENSSSSRVRVGTEIIAWFRVNARNGEYKWENLSNITGGGFSEDEFRKFIANVIQLNPDALAVEELSPWKPTENENS